MSSSSKSLDPIVQLHADSEAGTAPAYDDAAPKKADAISQLCTSLFDLSFFFFFFKEEKLIWYR